jgi:hypothetical protein
LSGWTGDTFAGRAAIYDADWVRRVRSNGWTDSVERGPAARPVIYCGFLVVGLVGRLWMFAGGFFCSCFVAFFSYTINSNPIFLATT